MPGGFSSAAGIIAAALARFFMDRWSQLAMTGV
jgi:hypothetical protein